MRFLNPKEEGGNRNAGTIAIVANLAWSVYNFRLPVVRALQAAGYRVVIIVPVDEWVSALLQEPGVELMALRHFRRNSTNIWASLKMIGEFRKIYKSLRPDAIIHYGVQANIFGNFAARLAGVPSVCVVTGLGYTFLHQGVVPWLTRWLYRASFLRASRVIFENKDDLDLMVKSQMLKKGIAGHVPGCGIDTVHFSPGTPTRQAQGPVFLLVGRLLYDKGIREYAKAAELLKKSFPAAECWLLGHLDEENPAHILREELVAWVKGGYIYYKGATDDVRPFIDKSDWIVLPSYREGLSRVLLEGLSMAKPIITTDTPGCRETVENGQNGFVVPVKNENALYQTMLAACQIDAEQRAAMGQWGRAIAIREYSAEKVGQHYVAIISSIIKENARQKQ